MHEYAVAQRLIAAAVEVALANGAGGIVAMHVRVGPDEHITPEALTLAMQARAQDTIARDAEVRVAWSDQGGVVLETVDVSDPGD